MRWEGPEWVVGAGRTCQNAVGFKNSQTNQCHEARLGRASEPLKERQDIQAQVVSTMGGRPCDSGGRAGS